MIIESIYSDFFKKFSFIIAFFILTPLTLIASVFSLVALTNSSVPSDSAEVLSANDQIAGAQVYASLPSDFPEVSVDIVAADARVAITKSFLEDYNSPLTPFADDLVKTSDEFGLDWRLLPAIAMKESGLCNAIPEGSHNCWGWGIHSKGTLMFDSYDEAIHTVAKGLKENYIDIGLSTPDEIMTKYAHPSSTTWAEGVTMYMDRLQ
jgi:hypothetical protein